MKRWLLLFCLWPAWAQATTYYVKTTGDNSAAGTSEATAWKHLWRASDSPVTAGDTILIRAGLYGNGQTGGDTTDYFDGAAAVVCHPPNGTTWKAYPGDAKPVIRAHLEAAFPNTGFKADLDTVTFDSLRITNCKSWGVNIQGATNTVIKNCDFDSIGVSLPDGGVLPGGNNPSCIGKPDGTTRKLIVANCTFNFAASAVTQEGSIDSMAFYGNVVTNTHGAVNLKISSGVQHFARRVHIYDNYLIEIPGGPFGYNAVNVQGVYDIRDIFIHHNVIYGNWDIAWRMSNSCCFDVYFPEGRHDRIFFYNNTIHVTDHLGGFAGHEHADTGQAGEGHMMDTVWTFNNIVITPEEGTSRSFLEQSGYMSYSFGLARGHVGPGWLFDYNACIDTTPSSSNIYTWCNAAKSGGVWVTGTCRQFVTVQWMRDSLPFYESLLGHCLNDTIIRAANGKSNFMDAANHDYRLNPGGPQYNVLATGGKGGVVWDSANNQMAVPTYMGAFEPTDTTCPIATQDTPADGATIEAYTLNLIYSVLVDGAGDDCEVLVLAERGDATPDDTLCIDTVSADVTDTCVISSLTEDSTYYWQVIATDTSCADATSVRDFLVDSIPAVQASAYVLLYQTTLQGVKLNQ